MCFLIFFTLFVPIVFLVGILSKEAYGLYLMGKSAVISDQIKNLLESSKILERANFILSNVGVEVTGEELNKAVTQHHAKGGITIVTNPGTGEILAIASAPGFDANQATKTKPEAWRIRSITDIFEPGSTFKIVVMMTALVQKTMGFNDKIFCENGRYKLFGELINDPEKLGSLTFKEIFKHSSNIGDITLYR